MERYPAPGEYAGAAEGVGAGCGRGGVSGVAEADGASWLGGGRLALHGYMFIRE